MSAAFSWSTIGFKFFQTSVVFHRGMAAQHKAESHQALLQSDCWDFTLQPLPGNQACTGTPTHWGLYSAFTFSGSHLLSCENRLSSKKAHLGFLDVFPDFISSIRWSCCFCFLSPPFFPFFHHIPSLSSLLHFSFSISLIHSSHLPLSSCSPPAEYCYCLTAQSG